MREIQDAAGVDVASAYFAPGNDQIEVLKEVPKLRIYVSEDFSISDPFSLESLSADAGTVVKCIGLEEGRFHAKVVLSRRTDGSKAATGAEAWMHPADADLVEQGQARRSWTPTPGVLDRILDWIYIRGVPDRIPPV